MGTPAFFGQVPPVTLPMAKSALASRPNLSAEHLSRILGELSAQGLVEVHGGRLRIIDAARLRGYRGRKESRRAAKVAA